MFFADSYPLSSKRFTGKALSLFISQFGVPEYLTFDGAADQCGKCTLFMKQVIKHGVHKLLSEPRIHNENAVEGVIREIRRR